MKRMFASARVLAMLLLILGCSTIVNSPALAQGNPVQLKVIAENFIIAREGRGADTPGVAQLPNGTTVPVIGEHPTAGWWQVKLPDGGEGWVNGGKNFVEIIYPLDASKSATPGSLLAFQNEVGGAIYLINEDGTNLRYLATGMDPAISPDRQWVAFTRWGINRSWLLLIKTDGTGERQLFTDTLMMKAPAWSADGTQIAITHETAGHKWHIAAVRVADGYFHEFASHDLSYSPTWSPDGTQIAYASDRGISLTWEDPTTAVTQDRNAFAITPFAYNDRSPAWSPDGKHIAFQYKKNDHSEIYLMDANGAGRTPLTMSPLLTSSVSPAWSPDGSRIAYLSNVDGDWNVWVVNIDGTNSHPMFQSGTLKDVTFAYHNHDERMISWR